MAQVAQCGCLSFLLFLPLLGWTPAFLGGGLRLVASRMGTPASPGCGGGGGDKKNKDMKTQQSLEQQPHQGPRDFRSRLASRGGVRKENPLTGDLGNSQSCPVPSGTQPGNVSSPPSCQGSRPRKQRSPKEPLNTDKNLRTKKRALIGLFPGVGGRAETTFQALTPVLGGCQGHNL